MNKSSGKVLALFISKKEISTRISRTTLKVDKEGIVGDKVVYDASTSQFLSKKLLIKFKGKKVMSLRLHILNLRVKSFLLLRKLSNLAYKIRGLPLIADFQQQISLPIPK